MEFSSSSKKKSWFSTPHCTKCRSPLSVGPVYISDIPGLINICGRCNVFSYGYTFLRNIVYEQIALLHSFTCAHEGCNDVIPWLNVEKHEENCVFKPLTCVINDCKWIGNVKHLQDHFKTEHKEVYLEGDEVTLDVRDNQKLILLVNTSLKMLFKIEIDFDVKEGVLKFKLNSLNIRCELNDIIESITLSIEDDCKNVVKKNQMYRFDEVFFVFKHIFSFLNKSKICCRITILTSKVKLKSNFLKVLCQSCGNSIIDYIYLDNLNNFIYCKRCKFGSFHKIPYNLYCTMLDSKSKGKVIELDDFVSCPNNGCPYEFKKENIENHIKNCPLKMFECKKCTFKTDFHSLKKHYIDYHLAVAADELLWTIKLDFGKETIQIIFNNAIFHIKRTRERDNSLYNLDTTCNIRFDVDIETICFEYYEETHFFQIELLHQKSDQFNLMIRGRRQNSSLIGKICVENSNLHEYRNEGDSYTFKIVIKYVINN